MENQDTGEDEDEGEGKGGTDMVGQARGVSCVLSVPESLHDLY